MNPMIRIGSRESQLAVLQAELVKQQLEAKGYKDSIEIVTMKTTGDRILDRNLDQIGGKGLFVKELDQALLDGKIDLAVHSLKDMPMEVLEDFPILAYTKREDPRDVLIYKPQKEGIPEHGLIGTSSKRRMIQLEKLYPTCKFAGIRGNVQTRLHKLEHLEYDATVLAAAGLKRLGMEEVIGKYFSIEEMLPSAGQGILAVQGRVELQPEIQALLEDPSSRVAAMAERAFVRVLDGGCSSPIAAFAQVSGEECCLHGLYYRESDQMWFRECITGACEDARKLGESLALTMRKKYGE